MTASAAADRTAGHRLQQVTVSGELGWLLDDLASRVPHVDKAVILSSDGLAIGFAACPRLGCYWPAVAGPKSRKISLAGAPIRRDTVMGTYSPRLSARLHQQQDITAMPAYPRGASPAF